MKDFLKLKNSGCSWVNLNSIVEQYRGELLIFLTVFIAIFSSLQMPAAAAPGNVEQWANLTNQMFYGGQDFLFSYGPLYWLTGGASSQYNIYTYWGAILYLSISIAWFWSIIITLSFNARAYVFFAVAFFLFFSSLNFPAALFLLPFAIVVYFEFSKSQPLIIGRRLMVALGALVGFLFYVRFFYGLAGLATFGSYFFVRFLVERDVSKIVLFVVGVSVSYVIFGLIIFHDAASIIDYVLINKELSFGNSVDMTLAVVNTKESFVAVFFVWLFLNLYLLLRRRSLILTVNVLFLLFFKLGFSRTDHYIGYFVIPAAVLALVMLFDKSRFGRLLFLLTMAVFYYISVTPSYPVSATKDSLRPAIDFSVGYESRVQNLYPNFKLEEELVGRIGKSTVDVYPYNNEYAFANKLNYKHRPSFQNYMTLTPTLDFMNERFFESPGRPKFIIWTSGVTCESENCNVFNGFDEKFSLNEDPLTVGAILLNYHAVSVSKGNNGMPLILLEENDDYTTYAETPISEEVMSLGKWYKVPKVAGGVVKVIPGFEFTNFGRVKNLLFRGSILTVRYKLVSGDIREYRLNVINSKSGIWVSPLLDNFEFSGDPVDSVMFVSKDSNYVDLKFRSRWVQVDVPGVRAKVVVADHVQASIPDVKESVDLICDGSIDLIDGVSPVPSKFNVMELLKVHGWLARSTKDGTLFDKILITLTDGIGNRVFISTNGQARSDLGVAFKNPSLNAAGYNALIDLSALSGTYTLGLVGVYGSKIYNCSQYSIPLTIEK